MQTNGLTERFNQTLSRCLAKIINEDQTDWDEKLDTVLMGYRASKQASTKHSPYYMFFQQQMRLPIDSEILQSPTSDDEQDSNDRAQKNQKETYDRKHLPEELPVGTEVPLENTAQRQRKGGKMDPVWLGPYTISKSMGKGVYELKNSDGEVLKKKANINRLKKFNHRQPQQAK